MYTYDHLLHLIFGFNLIKSMAPNSSSFAWSDNKAHLILCKENDQEILFLHSFLQFSFCLSFTAVCFHASLKLTPLEVGVGLLRLEVTSKEGRLWLPRIVKPIRLFINALVSVRRGITGTFFSQRFGSQIMTLNNQS